ncbi:AAA family ATPase [Moritella sp. 28]|uniref:AAA family ATPase n=1 Tax=Moritella sp. 28 TaxID=2746232 RepID=UPI001BA94781|nr:AAA family ATPase [Moritella sp. 28]QUM84593.1 AAA family ATPase [Moritella sp. 28]
MIVGLFVRHVKAYKGITFVPIGTKYKFVAYVGENGVGKSSILEALDSFFNGKPYPINKSALNDGIKTAGNEAFITPIFLIEKSKVPRQKKEFEKISTYFWNIERTDITTKVRGSMREFFMVRDQLVNDGYSSKEHYLMLVGESIIDRDILPKPYFSSFQGEESFLLHMLDQNQDELNELSPIEKKEKINGLKDKLKKSLQVQDWKKFFTELKSIYAYVYFPVELDVESFTKIETTEMQKIFDKKLKNEIEKSLLNVNLDRKDGINHALDGFVSEIENILNNEYCYHTGQGRNNAVTKNDLVNKILEVYFQKRILNRKNDIGLTKVSELSAGEKRQALINVVYAFLMRNSERENMVIIAIDEPESSLHTALCYDQFEKLKEISKTNQILITTHWYGFLPIVSEGYGHFINMSEKQINFETYDLFDYKAKVKQDCEKSRYNIPENFVLKSTYDLVQSIFYSLRSTKPYNWIVCEGISEKIYFEYFFKKEIQENKLRILPMGGQSMVIRLYKYLEIPISEDKPSGKVFCIVDTDSQRCDELNNGYANLTIKRLCNRGGHKKTSLLTLDNKTTDATDIEQSLDPFVFKKTLELMTQEDNYLIRETINLDGNSDFRENFRSFHLEHFFKENNGENKVLFAKQYIEVSKLHDNDNEVIPTWIEEIKDFFMKK